MAACGFKGMGWAGTIPPSQPCDKARDDPAWTVEQCNRVEGGVACDCKDEHGGH